MTSAEDHGRKLYPTVLDTSVIPIARVYARALYEAAAGNNQLEPILDEYQSFLQDVLDANPDFEGMLRSTIINREDKAESLRRIFGEQISPIFLNYLFVLNDHMRLDLLRPVFLELKAMHEQRLGRVPVEVRTAVPLDAAQEEALRERLRAVTAGDPVIHAVVDPALLGGMVVRIGDTVFDGSVSTKLERMREQLIQRSTHEIQSRRDQFSFAT
jgi:F-type H+-transporting ATPase subunit delta